jgi:hypothetical protein
MSRRVLAVLALCLAVAAAAVAVRWSPSEVRLSGAGELYAVEVTLDAVRTGVIDVGVTVRHRRDRAGTAQAVWLSAVMPAMGHASPELAATPETPDHFHVRGELFPMPGVWELAVRVRAAPGVETAGGGFEVSATLPVGTMP